MSRLLTRIIETMTREVTERSSSRFVAKYGRSKQIISMKTGRMFPHPFPNR